MKAIFRTVYLTSLACILCTPPINAQWKVFNKVVGAWDIAANWNPSGVPTASDSVRISETVIIPAGFDAMATKVHINQNGKMIITEAFDGLPRGRLLVQDGAGIAFLQEGELVIGGVLKVQNAPSLAFLNSGEVEIQSNGKLHIDSTASGLGIDNGGSIINYGNIISERTNDHAITNRDTLVNAEGALMEIRDLNDASYQGIRNEDSAYLLSLGKILIDSELGIGVVNYGVLTNADSLIIQNVNNGGLLNFEELTNLNEATILIKDLCACVDGNGVYSPIYAGHANFGGSVVNLGEVLIDDIAHNNGVFNDGYWLNAGLLDIENTQRSSFHNVDTLVNGEDAIVMINKIRSTSGLIFAEALRNDGCVVNNGLIDIEDGALVALRNTGEVHNLGRVEVRSAEDMGLVNELYFENHPSADLTIINISGPDAIAFHLSGDFVNFGAVLIEVDPSTEPLAVDVGGSWEEEGELTITFDR